MGRSYIPGACGLQGGRDGHFPQPPDRAVTIRPLSPVRRISATISLSPESTHPRIMTQSPPQPSRTTTTQPELLAPAGDFDAMRAAVANGADAVYFGLSNFNARHRATNFTLEQL